MRTDGKKEEYEFEWQLEIMLSGDIDSVKSMFVLFYFLKKYLFL